MSKETFAIEAEIRSDMGKGASRRLRRTGQVPAILYGGDAEPQSLQMSHKDLAHHLENEAFFSHILELKVGKDTHNVVLRDLQRHPAKPFVLHADFLRVNLSDVIRMNVPLHFLNEEISVGVKTHGGQVFHHLSEVEVSCAAKDLPEFIEVDMAEMDIGGAVHLSELVLPEGVELTALHAGDDADTAVASIHEKKAVEEEEPTEEAAAEGDADAGEADEGDA